MKCHLSRTTKRRPSRSVVGAAGHPGGSRAKGLPDPTQHSPAASRPPPSGLLPAAAPPAPSRLFAALDREKKRRCGQSRPVPSRPPRRAALTSSARGWRASSCRSRALRKDTPRSGGPLWRHRAPRGGTRPGRAGLTWRQEAGQLHLSPPLLASLAPGAALLLPGGVQLPPHGAEHPPPAPGPPPHVPAAPPPRAGACARPRLRPRSHPLATAAAPAR